MMVACNLISGLALTGLVLSMATGSAGLVMVYVVAVVVAMCDVAYTLPLQASIPDVVAEPDQLALGNGRLVAVEGAGEQFLARGWGGCCSPSPARCPLWPTASASSSRPCC